MCCGVTDKLGLDSCAGGLGVFTAKAFVREERTKANACLKEPFGAPEARIARCIGRQLGLWRQRFGSTRKRRRTACAATATENFNISYPALLFHFRVQRLCIVVEKRGPRRHVVYGRIEYGHDLQPINIKLTTEHQRFLQIVILAQVFACGPKIAMTVAPVKPPTLVIAWADREASKTTAIFIVEANRLKLWFRIPDRGRIGVILRRFSAVTQHFGLLRLGHGLVVKVQIGLGALRNNHLPVRRKHDVGNVKIRALTVQPKLPARIFKKCASLFVDPDRPYLGAIRDGVKEPPAMHSHAPDAALRHGNVPAVWVKRIKAHGFNIKLSFRIK